MISIVVPVFNEKESIDAFYTELTKELRKITEHYEILFIDDGSTDTSLVLLKELEKSDKKVSVYSFRKNQGKAEALTFGFQKAEGTIVVTLDADLQDKPSEIKKLLDKQQLEGIDIVSGWRKNRKDASKMVVISHLFNSIVGKLFDVHLHDLNCGLKVYTADAAKSLHLYGGQHRFIPLLASQSGFSIDEVVVEHQPRKFGKSKYGFSKIKDLPDIFTMLFLAKYTKRPLHFFGTVGGSLMILGFIFLLYLTVLHYAFGQTVGRRPLLLVSIFFMLGGLQIFFTGFLAELITSINQRNNPHFPLKYSSRKKS
jgi:glycosyltransferase involved in cell wall biosynthesis